MSQAIEDEGLDAVAPDGETLLQVPRLRAVEHP